MVKKLLIAITAILSLFGANELIGARVPDTKQVIFDAPISFVTTTQPLAVIQTSQKLLCEPPVVVLSSAVGSFAPTFAVGTTTFSSGAYVNTTTASIIASTYVPTTTSGYFVPRGGFNIVGESGSYYLANTTTTVPWLFRENEYVLLSSDFAGATSTNSFTTAGGFTLAGSLKLTCIKY